MFPTGPLVDDSVRPLGDDDQRVLLGLVHKYGLNSLMCALTGLGESSRLSSVSASNTLFSSNGAPSLVWTASDGASIRTQSTTGQHGHDLDVPAIHDAEMGKPQDHTWLESPCAVPSADLPTGSPKLSMATLKRYQCPMCFMDRNLVEFGRKSDFKKHLNNFHGTDVTWICRTKNCHLSFATERSYSTHAKEAHKMEALPSSAARTELCPQVVFACGFGACKDRLFEAANKDDAPNARDKYFEHIAKHFEDEWNVNDWEYKVHIQNLMRQQRVKPIWKTCIWPKERRTQLNWKPRSSGDLRRMLEARHLGEDISQLVRLAYVLGQAPFTHSKVPPPSEVDNHFQLPFRSQCLLETDSPERGSDDSTPTISVSKSRPQSLFRLPSRKSKPTRPSTPASINTSAAPDTPMTGAGEMHPGTPIPIPRGAPMPSDAPQFVPDNAPMPKQMQTPVGTPMSTPVNESPLYAIPMDEQGYAMYHHQPQHTHHHHHQPPTPATPVPHHKRPGSWSRVTSMEDMRPKKRTSTPHGSPYDTPMEMSMPLDQIPNAYGEMIPPQPQHHHYAPPTSVPGPEWALPMRESSYHYEPQQPPQHDHDHHHHHQQQHMGEPMTTFFFDEQ
ncbi:uncharacterized protein F5Z01DRAFT_621909 [Emericellopsis atlantica]|uniref:C2H2-type domain-containing protein n=1 Tax=Emericellopsis atlantica TaxID=2614577 RepID=A0A9P7ZMU1_9HYPO|nr:uncharacterized protein F5Z01DRAFT_621909 [Emericellopsis atlantica]KAG9254465.1 hypothetical protein F5Z01DRAFT_621909 [Emericellopsis atlantica]